MKDAILARPRSPLPFLAKRRRPDKIG
jgi:hypothetical protein